MGESATDSRQCVRTSVRERALQTKIKRQETDREKASTVSVAKDCHPECVNLHT